MPEPGRVLIVDDEENIRAGLRDLLRQEGFAVRAAATGDDGLALLERQPADVAIIDLQMPGISGIELLHAIRTRWPETSVIILTGRGTLETAMQAVREGAHDYLVKPAAPAEILTVLESGLHTARRRATRARLLSNLRGTLDTLETLRGAPFESDEAASDVTCYQTGELEIDVRTHEVLRAGTSIPVSPSEFKLLWALCVQDGAAVTYEALVETALGYQADAHEAKELVKRHILSLRRKIEPDPAQPRYLLNVRGVGYRLGA